MKFEEVDIAAEKPEYPGWFNITADVLPRACGRSFFNGKRFDLSLFGNELFTRKMKIYWLRGLK